MKKRKQKRMREKEFRPSRPMTKDESLSVGTKFFLRDPLSGKCSKTITIIKETKCFFILDAKFDETNKNIRIRKLDRRVMGGVLFGSIYI